MKKVQPLKYNSCKKTIITNTFQDINSGNKENILRNLNALYLAEEYDEIEKVFIHMGTSYTHMFIECEEFFDARPDLLVKITPSLLKLCYEYIDKGENSYYVKNLIDLIIRSDSIRNISYVDELISREDYDLKTIPLITVHRETVDLINYCILRKHYNYILSIFSGFTRIRESTKKYLISKLEKNGIDYQALTDRHSAIDGFSYKSDFRKIQVDILEKKIEEDLNDSNCDIDTIYSLIHNTYANKAGVNQSKIDAAIEKTLGRPYLQPDEEHSKKIVIIPV
jgi:hypothetical protein